MGSRVERDTPHRPDYEPPRRLSFCRTSHPALRQLVEFRTEPRAIRDGPKFGGSE